MGGGLLLRRLLRELQRFLGAGITGCGRPAQPTQRLGLVLSLEHPGPSSARNAVAGVVAEIVVNGALARVTVDLGELPLVATVTAGSVSQLGLLPGSRVVATIKATAVHLC